jgi:hypothetical protein
MKLSQLPIWPALVRFVVDPRLKRVDPLPKRK